MQKDAYYFPHFSNARNDRRLRRLQKELQIEGYGIYFMILEVLREQDGFKYPIDDIDLLADEFQTSEQKVRTVICNYQLFQVDQENNFFSIKFNEYLEPYLKAKEQRRLAGIASGKARKIKALEHRSNDRSTTVQRSPNENEQSKVKKSKVKKSKVKESKVNKTKLETTIDAFIDMRKKIKKPITDNGVKLMLNKLSKLSSDENTQIQILEESILNSWQGIFPLKEKPKTEWTPNIV